METNAHVHVLVVDDDPFMLELMRDMLETAGASKVTTAPSARAGLGALHGRPELLICDLSMPDMDGIEFLNAAAASGYDGSVLLLSGMDKGVLQAAKGLAAAQGLRVLGAYAKPMGLAELRAAVDAAGCAGRLRPGSAA
ncbi:response regulator [Pseudoduganella sp. GCM10020061]|uniref:response regulator n=1 Tax=Pseudoduganella sp. GCM10020061 TaxID=3317345 RepID=UPI0036395AC0